MPGCFEFGGINVRGVPSYHDSEYGEKLGSNIMFRISADNMIFVHMGDIGHMPTDEQQESLKPCDILALPVGGVYTIDTECAVSIVKKINPGIVIPVHYKTPSNRTAVNGPDEFLSKFMDIVNMDSWEGCRKDIPRMTTVVMLKPVGEN